jgi:hypothetical protein
LVLGKGKGASSRLFKASSAQKNAALALAHFDDVRYIGLLFMPSPM